MRIAACVAVVLACFATGTSAQSFEDLDFDAANVGTPYGPVELTWDRAAPGWSHADGDNTSDITWVPNAGYSQSYVLLVSPFGAASGAYGFGLKSGTFHEDEPRGPFVYAEISQTGRLGAQVTTLAMLGSSVMFEVTLNGIAIAMQPVGLDPTSPTYAQDLLYYSGEWTGDVSAFAGQVVDLQITDLMTSPEASMLAIDQIEFLPIPEASTAAMLALGLLAMFSGRWRRWPRSTRRSRAWP